MAGRLRDFCAAARVPLGVVLEGGYNREVLAESVCAILPVLADEVDPPAALVTASGCGPLTERAIARLGGYWPLG
jgi:acetoin utilization deacetylase AcuC-like enzyme